MLAGKNMSQNELINVLCSLKRLHIKNGGMLNKVPELINNYDGIRDVLEKIDEESIYLFADKANVEQMDNVNEFWRNPGDQNDKPLLDYLIQVRKQSMERNEPKMRIETEMHIEQPEQNEFYRACFQHNLREVDNLLHNTGVFVSTETEYKFEGDKIKNAIHAALCGARWNLRNIEQSVLPEKHNNAMKLLLYLLAHGVPFEPKIMLDTIELPIAFMDVFVKFMKYDELNSLFELDNVLFHSRTTMLQAILYSGCINRDYFHNMDPIYARYEWEFKITENDMVEKVKLLLKAGSNPNIHDPSQSHYTKPPMPPALHIAVLIPSLTVLELICNEVPELDVDILWQGFTPLKHCLLFENRFKVGFRIDTLTRFQDNIVERIKILLKKTPKVNFHYHKRRPEDSLLFQVASFTKDVELVKLLLERNIDISWMQDDEKLRERVLGKLPEDIRKLLIDYKS